jgi:hypothetical protein
MVSVNLTNLANYAARTWQREFRRSINQDTVLSRQRAQDIRAQCVTATTSARLTSWPPMDCRSRQARFAFA